ncbi:MAG: ABC transporter permease [Pseudomonadota bacterium]
MIWRSSIARSLLLALLVALLVATLCFWVAHTLPGDLALRVAAGRYPGVQPNQDLADVVRQAYGLDRPIFVQYVEWLGRVVRLDFGNSLITGRPVLADVIPYLHNSLRIVFWGFLAAVCLAVPIGFLCGRAPNSRLDLVLTALSAALSTIPTFLLGIFLVQFFIVDRGLGSLSGTSGVARLWLPILTIAIALAGPLSRVVRNAVADVRAQPFMVHALMRGVPKRQLFLRHGVRNALLPILNYLPVVFLFLIYDVIVIETVFNYRGVGWALIEAVKTRDIPVMQCLVLMLVVFYLVATAVTEAITRLLYRQDARR